jgi:hypothetical protein
MSNKSSLIKITDHEVKVGIEQGRFREDGTQVRDVANGHIVKVLKEREKSENDIPPTFIQINNNYVYQTDLSSVLDIIAHNRNCNLYEDLEEKYNLVLDYLDSYCIYNSNLTKLHESCLEISVSFDNRIRRQVDEIRINDIENNDFSSFKGSLDAYVKVLFTYIVSTFLLHRGKFTADKVIISKIISFKKNINNLYEQLLVESKKDSNGVNIIKMDNSLYTMYLFNDSYSLINLDRLVRHDSRFSSSLDVIAFFKKHFKTGSFKQRNSYYENNNDKVLISVSTAEIPVESVRNKLANKLLNILEDIERLKEIREEIVNLEEIKDEDVLSYLGI